MSKDSPSVLVVEDHAVFTTALLHMLQKGNIEVRDVATTAEEALQKLRDLQVDLVLVDISLPHMSGLDLVSEVNKLYPELPCVVLSGHVANHYVRRTRLRGQRQCRRAFRRDTARPGWGDLHLQRPERQRRLSKQLKEFPKAFPCRALYFIRPASSPNPSAFR